MATKRVTIKAYGQTFQLSHGTGNEWKVSAVMPDTSSYSQADHYYPVTVEAEDEAGNVTTKTVDDPILGEKLKLFVREITAPVITISSPTAGTKTSNKRPPVVFTVTDNDSGVDEDTIKLSLDGQTYTTANFTKEAVSGGYKYTYTPTADLPDDEYTATVSASDNDGNAATPKSVTFEVYAAAPTLSVTDPAEDGVTNKPSLQYAATTNGAELIVTVNGTPQAWKLTMPESAPRRSVISIVGSRASIDASLSNMSAPSRQSTHLALFGKSFMGESPSSVSGDVCGEPRVSRAARGSCVLRKR